MAIESISSGSHGSALLGEAVPEIQGLTKKLGRNEFLTLLVAQLRYQDPLNPLENTAFTAQLAQFSSLEQLLSVNENLEVIRSGQDQSSRLAALQFMGKEVEAEGNLLALEPGRESQGSFRLHDAADCTVLVRDSEGRPVREIPLGTRAAGAHTFSWDGRDALGNMSEPGLYPFEVVAIGQGGQSLPVETRIKGRVVGVNLEGASPLLYVGEIPVSLSGIRDIKMAETPQVQDADGTTSGLQMDDAAP